MAQGLITHATLEDIADAIREKLDTEDTYTPAEFASAVMQIPTGGVEIVPWSSGTDEQIVAMLQAAHNGDIDLQTDGGWAVGDVRSVTVGAFTAGGNISVPQQTIDIVITSFDEYMSCGNVLQFDFKNPLRPESFRMNASRTTVGGYSQQEMYTTTLPALINVLPTWLKNALIEFSCLVNSGGGSSTIQTVTGNKLALRSDDELGINTWSPSGEGTLIPYYSTASNRIKTYDTGTTSQWLLRSLETENGRMIFVKTNGNSDDNVVDYARYGLAPFGCL